MLKDFISEEKGQSLVEYALFLSFIALALSAVFTLSDLGEKVVFIFNRVRQNFNHPSNPFHDSLFST